MDIVNLIVHFVVLIFANLMLTKMKMDKAEDMNQYNWYGCYIEPPRYASDLKSKILYHIPANSWDREPCGKYEMVGENYYRKKIRYTSSKTVLLNWFCSCSSLKTHTVDALRPRGTKTRAAECMVG